MGTIIERKTKKGETRYRAEIRIKRSGYPHFHETKTFSSRKVAENWIKKRELEINENPNILLGVSVNQKMTLSQAIDKYLAEVGGNYGRSKIASLRLIQKFNIANIQLSKITPAVLTEHVALRKQGIPQLGLKGIASSTMNQELLMIRGVLSYANIMWDITLDINGFDRVAGKLRNTRQITRSGIRDRLPTDDELIRLTEYFFKKWESKPSNTYPMHLVIWFAIYSCRRQDEICRIQLKDYKDDSCLVRDLKNPNGSKGNHKTFYVNEKCKYMIDLALSDEYRQRMLKLGHGEEYIFPLNTKTVSRLFTDACHVLGIENLHFHDLRHEGCTRLAEQGCTIPQIQQVSLHDSWSSLQRYVSVVQRKKVLDYDDVMKIIAENRQKNTPL